MSESAILRLHELDLAAAEMRDPRSVARLKKWGFSAPEPLALERARLRAIGDVDRRWLSLYERATRRYGKAVAVVRDRVCQGCFITLPTSVSPGAGVSLTLCESCGRILFWP